MTVVSLFCGCGGLDLGLKMAGHNVIWANDFDSYAIQTYNKNIKSGDEVVICKSILEISSSEIPNCDMVVGGFPCQGFSMANPYRNESDTRNFLYLELLRVVRDKQPKVFLGENVQGITSLGGYETLIDKKQKLGRVFKMILQDFRDIGYDIKWQIVNSADYGVPQNRKRMIMVGVRKDLDLEFEFPSKTHSDNPKTVFDAIGDLPLEPSLKIPNHIGTAHKVKINGFLGNRHTEYQKPSPTIVGRGGGTGGPVILPHPSQTRRMTVREVARIQTFPDDFVFCGSVSSQYRQIGNAIPVQLGFVLGQQLNKIKSKKANQNLFEASFEQLKVN
jgi:DNA (cytosine-5)-methyltransferase 1